MVNSHFIFHVFFVVNLKKKNNDPQLELLSTYISSLLNDRSVDIIISLLIYLFYTLIFFVLRYLRFFG